MLLAFALMLTGCGQRQPTAANSAPPRPNVIFILVDTCRVDRLGCYGGAGDLSPWMDELAHEGVLFERSVATSSWTLPSCASFFCGYFPSVHKVTSYGAAMEKASAPAGTVRYFGEQFTTLTELLRANGYLTAGFSANPFITEKLGFAQGFDHFDSSFAANETPGSVVNEAATRWLAQRDRSKPFFMYLHYMDVHDPFKASDKFVEPLVDAVARLTNKTLLPQREAARHRPFFTKSARAYLNNAKHKSLFRYVEYWRARYDAGVPQVNEYLDQLRARLIEMKLWEDTYVILVADHGESLGEHGLWAHGLSAHQDQLHVPMILRWPGHLPAGRRIPQTVRLFDVMPTLLDQLNIPLAEPIQAKSLTGLLRGDGERIPPAFAEAVKQKPGEKAVVVDQWKLLAYLDEQRFELYNLDDDPNEQKNLAAEYPERVEELKRVLQEVMKENQARGAGVTAQERNLSQDEHQRLIELGYIQGEEEPSTQPVETQPASAPTTAPTNRPESQPAGAPGTEPEKP